jgi:hypothetical protein
VRNILFALVFVSASARAYDHAEDFKLHPEADIICSNEGGLFAIDDDKKAVAFGDRGEKELLTLQVQSFIKSGDFKYDIHGSYVFRMFTSSPEDELIYSIQISEKASAGVAVVAISTKQTEPQTAEPLDCSRR